LNRSYILASYLYCECLTTKTLLTSATFGYSQNGIAINKIAAIRNLKVSLIFWSLQNQQHSLPFSRYSEQLKLKLVSQKYDPDILNDYYFRKYSQPLLTTHEEFTAEEFVQYHLI